MAVLGKTIFKQRSLLTGYFFWLIIIFIGFYLHLYFSKTAHLPFDAGVYWHNGTLFYKDGNFSVLNYFHITRGYFLPLVYLPGHILLENFGLEPDHFSKIVGALSASLVFGYVLPRIWEVITNIPSLHWGRRLLFAFLGFALWSGYFAYTLSDFPAVLALSLSFLLIHNKPSFLKHIFAGFLFAAAINIRPMYMILIPIYLVLVLFANGKSQLKYLHKHFLPFLIGFVILSVPQLIINYKNLGLFSPFMHSEYKGRDLYLSQLEWGITIQKYETSIGTDYPSNSVFFIDPAGKAILATENLSEIESVKEYINLVLKYPVDFAAIYMRHFFNGLDLQYPTVYITKIQKFHWPVVFLNYTVIFLSLLLIFASDFRKLNLPKSCAILIILLPSLLVIPTAIECRFLLPLHLLFYALVAFGWPSGWKPQNFSFQTNCKFFLIYLIFLLTCFALSTNTQANLQYGQRLIGV